MRFDLRTHETLVLLAGILGLVEQELARLVFELEPSSVLSWGCVTLVLASIGLAGVRITRGGNGSQ